MKNKKELLERLKEKDLQKEYIYKIRLSQSAKELDNLECYITEAYERGRINADILSKLDVLIMERIATLLELHEIRDETLIRGVAKVLTQN